MNRAQAQELLDTAQEALDGLNHHVTLNGATAGSAAQSGAHVVVIGPPSLQFPTWHQIESTFTIWLVAGPDHITGWDRLDVMLERLAGPLELESAEPESLADPSSGTDFPAYRCTTSDTFYK